MNNRITIISVTLDIIIKLLRSMIKFVIIQKLAYYYYYDQ